MSYYHYNIAKLRHTLGVSHSADSIANTNIFAVYKVISSPSVYTGHKAHRMRYISK